MNVEEFIKINNIDIDALLHKVLQEYNINLFDFPTINGFSIICNGRSFSCAICPLSFESYCLASSFIRQQLQPLLVEHRPELFI